MPKIFISYRRADTQFVTDLVYEKMKQHFGKENVFLDVGNIPFGVDFRQHLNEQVAAHDVVLVVIGTEWAQIMKERANQQNDFVRIEIESALKQDKLVIPVLVKNANMPDFSDLPRSIKELQWRNSATIRRQPDLDNDCSRLAEGINGYFNVQLSEPLQRNLPLSKPSSKDLMADPFDWIEIPAGQVTLGKGYDEQAHSVGKTFPITPFEIAKYPVTNAQFSQFVDADGYKNQRWWTQAGWQQKQSEWFTNPRFWDDDNFRGDDKPVVGVSWYEAIAFCLWLSEETGEKITLPTEQQWQYAAQGKVGLAYPWGNEWNDTLCNNKVNNNGLGKTSSVTQYEGKGDSLFGVVDMAGNVWEWCLTTYETGSSEIHLTDSRVLRGGSWKSGSINLFLNKFRYWVIPDSWSNIRGFRVCRFK